MKILTVSNFYPPHYIGGYELGCQDVMRGLAARGHEVKVLTSRYGLRSNASANEQDEPNVIRALPDPYDDSRGSKRGLAYLAGLIIWEWNSLTAWRKVLRDFAPDIIYCWNLSGITQSIMVLAAQSGYPTAFYFSDDWLIQWPPVDPRNIWLKTKPTSFLKRAAKTFLDLIFHLPVLHITPRTFDLQDAQFTSQFLRERYTQAGLPTASAQVIHWGVDADRFPPRPASNLIQRRLLYVGQLVPHKGVHTVIEAFKILHQSGRYPNLELTLAGGSILPDYLATLVASAEAADLKDHVHFLGKVSRETLPHIYQTHDILVFPSSWGEPFSITLLEALSSKMAIVGTLTGGTREILVSDVNALVFPAEDAQACAVQLGRLLDDPALCEKLACAGRQTVKTRFQFHSMVDQIESALNNATERRRAAGLPVEH